VSFAFRGIAVCFSFYTVLYCVLSLTVFCTWRKFASLAGAWPEKNKADFLFVLRLFPFVTASALTLLLAVPSFVLLEPRSVHEETPGAAIFLSLCAMGLFACGMMQAVKAIVSSSRIAAGWSREASIVRKLCLPFAENVALMQTAAPAPPLATAGILRSEIWLSTAAASVLSENELDCAVQHEAAHVRRRDNLRKLLWQFAPFPGMRGLEQEWCRSSEMAADDAAVASAAQALDLASALIKLASLAPFEALPQLTMALVHSPADTVPARVARLLAWKEQLEMPRRWSLYGKLGLGAGCAVAFAVSYTPLLLFLHTATEWLVR
jgi:Zn-dependent protease with chaperone function